MWLAHDVSMIFCSQNVLIPFLCQKKKKRKQFSIQDVSIYQASSSKCIIKETIPGTHHTFYFFGIHLWISDAIQICISPWIDSRINSNSSELKSPFFLSEISILKIIPYMYKWIQSCLNEKGFFLHPTKLLVYPTF